MENTDSRARAFEHAEGEYHASERLSAAAEIVGQLRYSQNLTEISSEKESTVLFPLPMDLLEVFLSDRGKKAP